MADAATPAIPRVTNVRQSAVIEPGGKTVYTYAVNFMVGADGPFTVNVPADQFTADGVKQKMQEFTDTLNQLPR